MSEPEMFNPEAIAKAAKMPVEGLRVLRELMDAAQANDPMSFLVRAHRELESYISVVRESYINRASGILSAAGASAELELMHPFPAGQGPVSPVSPNSPQPTGFQPNKEEQ